MVDITNLDVRSKADEGVWTPMLHPETLEPLTDDDGNAAEMLIFGQAGRKVQQRLHELQQQKATSTETPSMKTAHETHVKQALVYVGGFRNLEANGEDLSDVKHAERIFDMTFPRMEIVPGSNVKTTGPEFRMANKPFALQAIEAAAKQGETLGND